MDQIPMHRAVGKRKILDRPKRVNPPKRAGRHVARAQEVGFPPE
jgi:hypothetical protein